ncbi:hypothetical protein MKAN_17405 [Mycobacterium kansasii ATCC 12478]|uniref:Uncharacterized protein n=1 Tax=Mycobacterium kansasii ATCC 12478 TaxID=557599 RepID=U5WYS8_MYCKA|nr:hypothetical protein MKAN_17405 [Mycobacterium kansasii ATCC 12478]
MGPGHATLIRELVKESRDIVFALVARSLIQVQRTDFILQVLHLLTGQVGLRPEVVDFD